MINKNFERLKIHPQMTKMPLVGKEHKDPKSASLAYRNPKKYP